jgi:RNA polymerase sigma-70 factor (ECF subfamily)
MKDLQLWQALKAGNKSALESIYRAEAKKLIKYGRKFSRDAQLVEDCVQDLFVELWKNRANLGDTDSIARYLFTSLRRKVIRKIEQTVKKTSSEEPKEYHFEAEIAIEERLINLEIAADQKEQLETALKNLSKRQQEALYLKYFAEMDYKDIADVMEVNYQSVRNLVFNALKS